MEIKQIENLYKINGLDDFQLRNTKDILKVHGVDFKEVDGYNRLDDLNRAIYEKFIVNIFNTWGLESRATLVPKGIYFVEEIQFLVNEDPKDDYYTVSGGVVMAVDRRGLKTVLRKWEDEDYKHLDVKESEATQYLRFEYEHQGRSEWLHVINDGKEWY